MKVEDRQTLRQLIPVLKTVLKKKTMSKYGTLSLILSTFVPTRKNNEDMIERRT